MSEATTTARVSLGVILFDISEAIFGKVQRSLMNHAEIERVGTKDAIFDRYHLKNLAFFAFACCEYCAIVRGFTFLRMQLAQSQQHLPNQMDCRFGYLQEVALYSDQRLVRVRVVLFHKFPVVRGRICLADEQRMRLQNRQDLVFV